ncbi:MAG: DUF1572 family protein [Gemmatimonadaceae bacterium]
MTAPMPNDLAATTLATCIAVFSKQKTLAERAIAQLDDQQLFATLDSEANSVATIVKHLAGNMRSRWSDFLTTDGEKPDRERDAEFVLAPEERSRDIVLGWWNSGWSCLSSTLNALTPADLSATVTIRGEKMPAIAAIFRQLDHYGQHVGQIVLLAKHLKGADWQTLSIPKGKSKEVEAKIRAELAAKRD